MQFWPVGPCKLVVQDACLATVFPRQVMSRGSHRRRFVFMASFTRCRAIHKPALTRSPDAWRRRIGVVKMPAYITNTMVHVAPRPALQGRVPAVHADRALAPHPLCFHPRFTGRPSRPCTESNSKTIAHWFPAGQDRDLPPPCKIIVRHAQSMRQDVTTDCGQSR